MKRFSREAFQEVVVPLLLVMYLFSSTYLSVAASYPLPAPPFSSLPPISPYFSPPSLSTSSSHSIWMLFIPYASFLYSASSLSSLSQGCLPALVVAINLTTVSVVSRRLNSCRIVLGVLPSAFLHLATIIRRCTHHTLQLNNM